MGRELHVHSHPSRVEHWRHLIEIAALAIAAIWGFYVFVYQERIKPASEPAELQALVSVDSAPLKSDKEFVRVGIRMKNIGQAPLELAGVVVNAYGVTYSAHLGEHVEEPQSGIVEISRAFLPGVPQLQYTFADRWKPFGSSRVVGLQPGAEFPETFVFAVPPRAFDVVKIDYIVCWARPGSTVWPIRTVRQADGSFWFKDAISKQNVRSGLICQIQSRGDYYPL